MIIWLSGVGRILLGFIKSLSSLGLAFHRRHRDELVKRSRKAEAIGACASIAARYGLVLSLSFQLSNSADSPVPTPAQTSIRRPLAQASNT